MGLTGGIDTSGSSPAVHPHVRGAHTVLATYRDMITGPSPRAWGSHDTLAEQFAQERSIPTCVGLTVMRT